jgi:hypothetical protein
LFFDGQDVRQLVFNAVYHLKQDIAATWRLPARTLMDTWKQTEAQYDFEKKQQPK